MRTLASAGVTVIFWTMKPCGGAFSVRTSMGMVLDIRRDVTTVMRSGLIPATVRLEGALTMARVSATSCFPGFTSAMSTEILSSPSRRSWKAWACPVSMIFAVVA